MPRYALLIPTEGCGPCIQTSIDFAARYQFKKELLVIVTGTSRKIIDLKLDKAGILASNVVIDEKGLSLKHGFVSLNPILYLGAGDERQLVTLEPMNINQEFEKLSSLLK
jgi:hypothetical protein